MIQSFTDKVTESLFDGGPRKDYRHLPPDLLPIAVRPLKDELAGFHAIRVNDQWSIIFRWHGSDAFDRRCGANPFVQGGVKPCF